jgi:hypothetical protein
MGVVPQLLSWIDAAQIEVLFGTNLLTAVMVFQTHATVPTFICVERERDQRRKKRKEEDKKGGGN